jgi:hypothetical protein
MSSSPMHLTGPDPGKPEREGLAIVPVLIVIGVLGLVGVMAWQVMGQHAVGTVAITKTNAVEMPPGDRVVVELEMAIQNTTDKVLKYHSMQLKLRTDQQEFKDDPAAATEAPRIYQSYPSLKQSGEAPLQGDMLVQPGGTLKGVVIVAFPVNKATFDARKSLEATVYFYDESPIRTKK